jgi:Nif-specific regulatory protein
MLSKVNPRKFNKLIEINTLINSDYQDLNILLTRIVESAMQLCGGEASSLLLADEEHRALYFEVALGSRGHAVKRYKVKMGEGIAGWVAQHNKSIMVNDVESDSRHLRTISRQIGYPVQTMLAVPMRVRDKCIGVVEVINKSKENYFDQEDLEWLEIFADQAALAITNAKSFERACSEIQLLQDRTPSAENFHTMVTGKSAVMRNMLKMADNMAKNDSSVLILGESGVGKELIAERIHQHSSRSRYPFVRVNCAALPEGILESELFGHVKGAFTSAVNSRKGRFEAADGGTIFLDEIGDMPLALQAKLLRVLQGKTFEKVGSDKTVKVNTRILAATNKDIEAMVKNGEFRDDLFYRLTLILTVPPLRDHAEDIPELARFFLDKFMQENKKNFEGFAENAIEAMLTYSWPGNIRELENCIERACVIAGGKRIKHEDLFSQGGGSERGSKNRNLKTAINVFKSNFVRTVLEENAWNQTEAAKALNIQRTYLSRLVKELSIREE